MAGTVTIGLKLYVPMIYHKWYRDWFGGVRAFDQEFGEGGGARIVSMRSQGRRLGAGGSGSLDGEEPAGNSTDSEIGSSGNRFDSGGGADGDRTRVFRAGSCGRGTVSRVVDRSSGCCADECDVLCRGIRAWSRIETGSGGG